MYAGIYYGSPAYGSYFVLVAAVITAAATNYQPVSLTQDNDGASLNSGDRDSSGLTNKTPNHNLANNDLSGTLK